MISDLFQMVLMGLLSTYIIFDCFDTFGTLANTYLFEFLLQKSVPAKLMHFKISCLQN